MKREALIKTTTTSCARVAVSVLIDFNCTFTYHKESNYITAFLDEEQAKRLGVLAEVVFTEPSNEELAELEDEVYGIAEVVKDGFFEIEPTTIQFNKYDMYGDEIPYYAEVTGFSIDHLDIELETTDMETPTIDDIIKPSDKLDILSKIRETLKEK